MKKIINRAVTVLIGLFSWVHEFTAKAILSPSQLISKGPKSDNGTDFGILVGIALYLLIIVGKVTGSTAAVFAIAGAAMYGMWVWFGISMTIMMLFILTVLVRRRMNNAA